MEEGRLDEQLGSVIKGKYRIERLLGEGGFGAVFLATHLQGRVELGKVVVKRLHPQIAASEVVRRRFFDEVRIARELRNPHIVRVFDLDEDEDGIPFLVQEFVEGQGLDELLSRCGRLSPAQAITVILGIAEGLAEAHAKQIIHRDIKPENIRLDRETGMVKILDFGIARVVGPHGTATTSLIGTPRYMAPEQIRHRQLDGRADIFALGVMLFELIAGEPPIPSEESEMDYLHLNLSRDPRPLEAVYSSCPDGLASLVRSMLAKEPDRRPPNVTELATSLRRIALAQGWSTEPLVVSPLLESDGASQLATQRTECPKGTPTVPTVQARPAIASSRSSAPSRRSLLLVGVAILLGTALLGSFVLWWLSDSGSRELPPADSVTQDNSNIDQVAATRDSDPVTETPLVDERTSDPSPATQRPVDRSGVHRTGAAALGSQDAASALREKAAARTPEPGRAQPPLPFAKVGTARSPAAP
jgi:serine/threonine-protein kinase